MKVTLKALQLYFLFKSEAFSAHADSKFLPMRSFRQQLERKVGKITSLIAFSSCYIFSSVI